MKPRTIKWLRLAVPGCLLLQLSACIGDPQFFIVSTIVNGLVFNGVSAIFSALVGGV
jgi:hypothetical protein